MAANTPIAAEPITVTVDSRALGACLAACMKHYATDETRPTLNRVHIIAEGSFLTFEATDGYRALRYRVLAEGIPEKPAGTYQLDRSEVKAIYATLPKSGAYLLELQPCSSSYPELERLQPTPKITLRYNRRYLLDALNALKGAEFVEMLIAEPKMPMVISTDDHDIPPIHATVLIAPAFRNG